MSKKNKNRNHPQAENTNRPENSEKQNTETE